MFSICNNFININGDLFQVKRTFKEEWMLGKDLEIKLLNCEKSRFEELMRNNK